VAGWAVTGPWGSPTAAVEPKTPLVPGAIGLVEGTGAAQPWLSATSLVQGSGGGSAFEQRSIRKPSAQKVRATHLVWKSAWNSCAICCWRVETRVARIWSATVCAGAPPAAAWTGSSSC